VTGRVRPRTSQCELTGQLFMDFDSTIVPQTKITLPIVPIRLERKAKIAVLLFVLVLVVVSRSMTIYLIVAGNAEQKGCSNLFL
jgi:hypothetical protein